MERDWKGQKGLKPLKVDAVYYYFSGWWIGIIFVFPDIGTNHSQLTFIFFRGVETTSQERCWAQLPSPKCSMVLEYEPRFNRSFLG